MGLFKYVFIILLIFISFLAFASSDSISNGNFDKTFLKNSISNLTKKTDNCISLAMRDPNKDGKIDIPLEIKLPSTKKQYTFENPAKVSWSIILSDYNAIYKLLNSDLVSVIERNDLSKCTYKTLQNQISLLRKIDRLGSSLSRLIWLEEDQEILEYFSWRDLRGFLRLKQIKNSHLQSFKKLVSQSTYEIKKDLVGMCKNKETRRDCEQVVKDYEKENVSVEEIFELYKNDSEDLYNSFFRINERTKLKNFSVKNTENGYILEVPFVESSLGKFKNLFETAIQSAWSNGQQKVIIKYVENNEDPKLVVSDSFTSVFKLDQIGQTILNFEERDINGERSAVSDTMAHEFGHILGFPDCYVEFYDLAERAYVYYILSESDIMCASKGKVRSSHFAEIKRVYRKSE